MHALLERIRRGRESGRGEFTIGDPDRVARAIVRVPLARVGSATAGRTRFIAVAPDGPAHDAPLHRIREIRRDGELLRRPGRPLA